jgi:hypothetical protein
MSASFFQRATLAACMSVCLGAGLLGQAHAATYSAQSSLSQLQLSVTDLTPGDANIAGFSFNSGNTENFIGSVSLVDPLDGGSVIQQLVRSTPVTLASPFDAASTASLNQSTRSALAQAGQNSLSSTVSSSSTAAPAYAQSIAAAINLDLSTETPLSVQNSITLAAYSSLTITGKARISLSVTDAEINATDLFEIDAQAALISSDLFDRFLSNTDSQTLEITSNLPGLLNAAGFTVIVGGGHALPQTIERDLSLTIVNNTAQARQLGLAAATWTSVSGVPEPETWALAACGLLVAGVTARRKTRQS